MRVKRTVLDRITAELHAVLRRETSDVIRAGNLLIESHKHLGHGKWLGWLTENFDLSYRTARRYEAAAEYVAWKGKSDTLAHFENLSPTVLYALAEGRYGVKEAQAILTATREGRVDQHRAATICDKLVLPEPQPAESDDAESDDAEEATSDEDIEAILDGPPPAVPPPAPLPPPPDSALRDFDQAIGTLKRLTTKPSAQFARTGHSANDLTSVEAFIRAVSLARGLSVR